MRKYKYDYRDICLVKLHSDYSKSLSGFKIEGCGYVYDLMFNEKLLLLNESGRKLISWLIRQSYLPEDYGGKLKINHDNYAPYRYYEDEYLIVHANYYDDEFIQGFLYSVSRYPERNYIGYPLEYTMLRGDKRIFVETNDLDSFYSIAKILDNPKYIEERYHNLSENEFKKRVSLYEL